MDREVESGRRCWVCTQACCSQGRGTCRRGNDCPAGRSFYSRFLETEGSPRRATQGRPRVGQEAEGVKGNGGKSLRVDSVGRGGNQGKQA